MEYMPNLVYSLLMILVSDENKKIQIVFWEKASLYLSLRLFDAKNNYSNFLLFF